MFSQRDSVQREGRGCTNATDCEWYEVPSSFSANLKNMVDRCEGKKHDEDDSRGERRNVAIEDVAGRVINIGVISSHGIVWLVNMYEGVGWRRGFLRMLQMVGKTEQRQTSKETVVLVLLTTHSFEMRAALLLRSHSDGRRETYSPFLPRVSACTGTYRHV